MNRIVKPLAITSMILAIFVATTAAEMEDIPRTEFGQPDLQGIWYYGTSTPIVRPERLGTKQSYTADEALELLRVLEESDRAKAEPLQSSRSAPSAGATIAQGADHNFASLRTNPVMIDGQYRTSQIISPENGRFPFKDGSMDMFQKWQSQGHGAFDGPEIRPASERCAGPNGGPMAPMIGWFYNANMQIVQTEDYIMLLAEMNHDARIISLTKPTTDNLQPKWMGNSFGHWEGNVLIVETSGFRPEQSWFAFLMSEQLEVTERFELLNEDEIRYSYTFVDPEIYSDAVTVEKNITRRAEGEQIFEYACHEGNYSMASILAGARRLEADMAESGN